MCVTGENYVPIKCCEQERQENTEKKVMGNVKVGGRTISIDEIEEIFPCFPKLDFKIADMKPFMVISLKNGEIIMTEEPVKII